MGLYIALGIILSLILIAIVWTYDGGRDDLQKWLLTIALAGSGWALWPAMLFGAVAYGARKAARDRAARDGTAS